MKFIKKEKITKIFLCVTLTLALVFGCIGSKYANDVNNINDTNIKTQTDSEQQEQKQETSEVETKNSIDEQTEETLENETDNKANIKKENEVQVKEQNEQQEETINEPEGQEDEEVKVQAENVPAQKLSVMYNSHIQDVGWERDFSVKDGQTSGTSGRALRLEAMKIKLDTTSDIGIKYQTHVAEIGWQGWKQNGELAGTQGRALRLEAIKIELTNTEKYSVMYRVHVAEIGWQDWRYDGEIAGTEGKALRLEAIEIKVIEKVTKGKLTIETPISDIYYDNTTINVSGWKLANVPNTTIQVTYDDTKIENISYKGRADVLSFVKGYGTIKENPTAGFEFDLPITGTVTGEHLLKIDLVTKDNVILESYSKKIKIDKGMHIKYSSHVAEIGWQDWRQNGELSGTEGRALRLEAIKLKGINVPEGVNIKYQTHVSEIGWQDWKTEGETAGTEGKALSLEAIRIKLEGTSEYSIMYRTHVADIGWQDWCYDGETSGTQGLAKQLEAIEIKIVPKVILNRTEIAIDSPINTINRGTQKVKGWIMTSFENVALKILIDNKEVDLSRLQRTSREDVKNSKKGFGDENIYNPTPGFEMNVDFSEYTLGTHTIKVQTIHNNNVIKEITQQFTIQNQIFHTKGTYGYTGLKAAGDARGSDLEYYQYGTGPNVFFATFAIHGFEDLWWADGSELVEIADKFYQRLIDINDSSIAEKWTIYIFPGINQDGLRHGNTNNGPGRTTLYSQAPNHKGIDMNRCWQVGSSYTRYTDNRNYNGTSGFQAYEAQALRNFLLNHKSQNGQTVLVDLHGWTQQLIGDPTICSFYGKQFPENDSSAVGRYGTGYLVNWARLSLGSSSRNAKAALIELPHSGITGHQAVLNKNFPNRYIDATLDMLRNI